MKNIIVFVLTITTFIVLVSFSSGCSQAQAKLEQMKPEVRGVTLAWGAVTPQTTEVLGTIKVYNPNSITLPVKKVSCVVYMDGINMGSAETTGLQIEKQSEFPVKITAKIDNTKIPAFWAEHIKRNEKSEASIEINITFDLKVTDFTFPYKTTQPIETNLLSSLAKVGQVPVEKKVKLPILGEKTIFKATLESLSGKWGTITPQSTQVNVSAIIFNQNPYPLVAPRMEYKADVNGISLGSGESGMQMACGPNSRGDINIAATLNTGATDKWFVTHIQQGEKSTFNMSVALVFDPPGYDKFSYTVWEGSQTLQTDILGKVKIN
jgi:LEA14-like dessication related protein